MKTFKTKLCVALLFGSLYPYLALAQVAVTQPQPQPPAVFTNESRAGIVAASGNSKVQTYDLAQKNAYAWNASKFGAVASFLRSKSSGVESAKRWNFGLRYDYNFSSRWALFLAQSVEGDRYAGFYQRYNTDLGPKYTILNTDTDQWTSELGYRFQHENQTSGNVKNTSFGRVFMQYERKWTATFSTKLWVEFLQSFRLAKDQFLNAELSSNAMISKIFSIQLAYLARYRNLPPPEVQYRTDTTLTMSLVAKF